MKKYLIPRITSALSHNERGKGAELMVNAASYKDNPMKFDDALMDKYDDFIRLNHIDRSVMFNFPKQARRLSERRAPCLVRRQKEEDERRAIDRNIVTGFCDWFMWTQSAYKPPSNKGKKKK